MMMETTCSAPTHPEQSTIDKLLLPFEPMMSAIACFTIVLHNKSNITMVGELPSYMHQHDNVHQILHAGASGTTTVNAAKAVICVQL
jgi:hypothetical protein